MFPLGLLSQGGGAGSGFTFEQIATTISTGSSGTITFSSIPQTYKHLQVRYTARQSGNSSVPRPITVNYNGQGSTYRSHYLYGTGSQVLSIDDGAPTIGYTPVLTGTTNSFAGGILDILDYSAANKNATYRCVSGYLNGASSSGSPQTVNFVSLASGLRTTTTAITQLAILAGSGNFESGSRFTLYGIAG